MHTWTVWDGTRVAYVGTRFADAWRVYASTEGARLHRNSTPLRLRSTETQLDLFVEVEELPE